MHAKQVSYNCAITIVPLRSIFKGVNKGRTSKLLKIMWDFEVIIHTDSKEEVSVTRRMEKFSSLGVLWYSGLYWGLSL